MSNGRRAVRGLRADTAQLLAESEAAFAAKFSSFKQSVTKSRVTSALNHHQLAWRKEALALAKQRKAIEGETDTWLTNMCASGEQKKATSEDASLAAQIRDVVDTRVALQSETHACARELQAAVRRAKAMLKAARQQKALEVAEQKTAQANAPKPKPTRKRSVGFAVPPSAAELKAESAPHRAPTTAAMSPLSTFLSSFLTRAAIDQQQLQAEENNLVQQLLLMQDTLDRFEAPVDTEELEPSPLIELTEADQVDGRNEQKVDTPGGTFITADSLSPRLTRRTHRSTMSLLSSNAFPPLPALDPALLTLPTADLERAHEARADQWHEAASTCQRELDRRFELNLSQLRDTFQAETASMRRTIDQSDRESGWSANHAARLQSIQSSYKTQGATRAQLIDRLKLEFANEAKKRPMTPGAGARDLLCLAERVDFAERTRTYKTQRTALHTAWEAERGLYIVRAQQELLASDRAIVAEHNRARVLEDQQSLQTQLHSELSVLREEKAERDAVKAAADAIKQQEADEEQAIKAERESLLREQQRTLLRLYHEHMAAEEADVAAQVERERVAMAEEARIALEANKPKVERRQELLQLRRAEQAQREDEARLAEEAREARLEAMRQLVAPSVERDSTRAMQATQASASEGDASNPLFAVHGYDMSTLLKDKRFRLQLALWNAGMSNTPYAKQMIASASPAIAPRPDMQSTIFAGR